MRRSPARLRDALLVLIAALVAPSPTRACSMCMCGDPTYRLVGNQMFGGQTWRMSLEQDRYAKDQVWDQDPTGRETESENRTTLAAAWSPRPALRLLARLPYSSRTITNPDGSQFMSGVSDPDLIANVGLRQGSGTHAWWLALTAGIKTPWGQNDRELGGVRADEHLQPGNGAAALSGGLAYSLTSSSASHWFASANGRWNGTNRHGYHYGEAIIAVAAYQRGLASWLSAAGELNFRHSGRDQAAGTLDPNTGGAVLYLTPRVNFAIGGPLALKLGVQIPVVQHLYGDQNEHANVQSALVVAL
jgi:hypothetical protein